MNVNKSLKRSKGFTIVELLLVIILIGIIGFSIYYFFHFSIRMQATQKQELDFQSDMRDSMLRIDREIKKSRSVFAIQEKDFLNSSGEPFDRKWIYIGVPKTGPNAGQVCLFKCTNPNDDKVKAKWEVEVLTSGTKNMTYEFLFEKTGDKGVAQKKLEYSLTGESKDGIKRTLSSTAEVLTAGAVSTRGTKSNPSRVLAIRNGDVKIKNTLAPSLTFVVDLSDSMRQPYHSYKGSPVSRFEMTKIVLNEMLTKLRKENFAVDVSVVPFAKYAKIISFDSDPWKFANLLDRYDDITQKINDLQVNSYFDSSGYFSGDDWHLGTNIGDALRVACLGIDKNRLLNPKVDKKRYLILLTDGEPWSCIAYLNSSGREFKYHGLGYAYYYGDELYQDSPRQVRSITDFTIPEGKIYKDYSYKIAEMFRSADNELGYAAGVHPVPGLKPFIISLDMGYSSAINYFRELNSKFGSPVTNYHNAKNPDELAKAISEITEEFANDTWTYDGPKSGTP